MRAFLDTNSLYGQNLRNFLLWCAFVDAFVAHWSNHVLDELDDELRELGIDEGRRTHLLKEMANAFPDALVPTPEDPNGFGIQDPDDVPVIDAAVEAGCEVIVTDDAKHFTPDVLAAAGLERCGAEDFGMRCLDSLTDQQLDELHAGFGDPSKLSAFPTLRQRYVERLEQADLIP